MFQREVGPCYDRFNIFKPLCVTTAFQKLQKSATFPSLQFLSRSRHWSRSWAFPCWNDIIGNLCAGEHFYKKSLVLVSDYEQMCSEAAKIARGDEAILKIGYLRSHSSPKSYDGAFFCYRTGIENLPCILVASKEQQAIEREFYQTIIGIPSEILFAENLEEARLIDE